MPPQDFDELAKALASRSLSRRDALRWVGAALLGGMLGSTTLSRAQAKPIKECKEDAQCPTGTTCVKKQCLTSEGCPPGLTLCSGLCYNLQTDNCNCNACGNVCAGSQQGRCCVNGTCTEGGLDVCPTPGSANYCQAGIPPVDVCPGNQTICSGSCVDLSSDPENCGACGNVCMGSGQGRCCLEGQCVEIGTPGATC